MSENAVGDYLRYVREVLGVRQIVRPKTHDPERSQITELVRTRTGHWPEPAEFDLVVLHDGEGLFEGATGELWSKMKTAMKIEKLSVLEIESLPDRHDLDGVLLEVLEVYPTPVSLVLSREPLRGDSRILGLSKVFESYAPSMLVEAADLKRNSWSDLQLVMKNLILR